jgi:hypothetical protein
MSLTSLLKDSADMRERFRAEFLMPPFELGGAKELLAPPLSKNYSLIGTAFDYLLRFYIERLNPKSKTVKWIAKQVIFGDEDPDDFFAGSCPRKFRNILTKADNDYHRYLANGKIDDNLLRTVLCLAQIDVCCRRNVDDLYLKTIGKTDRKDVKDLAQLIGLAQPKFFRAKKTCILNPTFGRASNLVGGADCDLIIDDALIEIKTTKDFKVRREYFDQLIGYYILYKIGGINGLPKGEPINRLGIYFSRYGCMWLFDVDTVIKEKQLPKFIRWFKSRV